MDIPEQILAGVGAYLLDHALDGALAYLGAQHVALVQRVGRHLTHPPGRAMTDGIASRPPMDTSGPSPNARIWERLRRAKEALQRLVSASPPRYAHIGWARREVARLQRLLDPGTMDTTALKWAQANTKPPTGLRSVSLDILRDVLPRMGWFIEDVGVVSTLNRDRGFGALFGREGTNYALVSARDDDYVEIGTHLLADAATAPAVRALLEGAVIVEVVGKGKKTHPAFPATGPEGQLYLSQTPEPVTLLGDRWSDGENHTLWTKASNRVGGVYTPAEAVWLLRGGSAFALPGVCITSPDRQVSVILREAPNVGDSVQPGKTFWRDVYAHGFGEAAATLVTELSEEGVLPPRMPTGDARHGYWTCQVCWNAQALTASGVMHHHGYRRPGIGYIFGDCPGVNELPWEVDCAIARSTLADWRAQRRGILADLERINAGAYADPLMVEGAKGAEKIAPDHPAYSRALDAHTLRIESILRRLEGFGFGSIRWLAAAVALWQPAPKGDNPVGAPRIPRDVVATYPLEDA